MLEEVLLTLMLVLESHWTTETIRHVATFLTATLCKLYTPFSPVTELTRCPLRFCRQSEFRPDRFTRPLRFVRTRRSKDRQYAVHVVTARSREAARPAPLPRQVNRARQIRQSRHDQMDPPLPPRQGSSPARSRLRSSDSRQATASRTALRDKILGRLILSAARRTPSAPLELLADPSCSPRPPPRPRHLHPLPRRFVLHRNIRTCRSSNDVESIWTGRLSYRDQLSRSRDSEDKRWTSRRRYGAVYQ